MCESTHRLKQGVKDLAEVSRYQLNTTHTVDVHPRKSAGERLKYEDVHTKAWRLSQEGRTKCEYIRMLHLQGKTLSNSVLDLPPILLRTSPRACTLKVVHLRANGPGSSTNFKLQGQEG